METSRIIDYHLKERIEGQNSKITSTGSYPFFQNPADPKVQFDASYLSTI
jgi:hypothetical protein